MTPESISVRLPCSESEFQRDDQPAQLVQAPPNFDSLLIRIGLQRGAISVFVRNPPQSSWDVTSAFNRYKAQLEDLELELPDHLRTRSEHRGQIGAALTMQFLLLSAWCELYHVSVDATALDDSRQAPAVSADFQNMCVRGRIDKAFAMADVCASALKSRTAYHDTVSGWCVSRAIHILAFDAVGGDHCVLNCEEAAVRATSALATCLDYLRLLKDSVATVSRLVSAMPRTLSVVVTAPNLSLAFVGLFLDQAVRAFRNPAKGRTNEVCASLVAEGSTNLLNCESGYNPLTGCHLTSGWRCRLRTLLVTCHTVPRALSTQTIICSRQTWRLSTRILTRL